MNNITKPKLIPNPDISDIKNIAIQLLDTDDDDMKQYLYEAVMIAFYGENVFNYINYRCE